MRKEGSEPQITSRPVASCSLQQNILNAQSQLHKLSKL